MPGTTRWQAPAMRGLRRACSCYGHLAGTLGVGLCGAFVERGWVHAGEGHGYALTQAGIAGLQQLGLPLAIDIDTAGTTHKHLLYGCVDWSERRDHFAGPLAMALLDVFVDKGWLRRQAESRELLLTAAGKIGLLAALIGQAAT